MARRIALAVVLLLVVPALAVGASSRVQTADERVPSAQLQATGSGAITVAGRMVLYGTIPGRGSLVVIDRGGDATVHVAGVEREFSRRRVRVKRASGIVFVTGSNVSVQILGVDLTFSVAGHGRARLLGTGVYVLNDQPEKAWNRAWIRVAPTSAEARRESRCASCFSSVAPRR